jgi:adenylate kinase family enzyme
MSNNATLRIHITGASGSGTTTLGRVLAETYKLRQFDTDDYFWIPTDPPYQHIRPREERLALLQPDLAAHQRWVLSGSLSGWGDVLRPLFDLVIFLYVPSEIRLERVRKREIERHGADSLLPGGRMHQQHQEFMSWTARYDEGDESVRSLLVHNRWLATLDCPIIRLEGVMNTDELLSRIGVHLDIARQV